jgi:uncharacterized protein YycO
VVGLAVASVLATVLFVQCQGTKALDRKKGPEYAAELASWKQAIDELAADGMWLIARGYHVGDDLVAIATNAPLSHASVLDKQRGQVIEAVGKGVVVTDLDDFVRDSHRLLIIEPASWTPERGREAVVKARGKVGAGYDYLGIVGVPSKKHFYCSELAVWSMGVEVDRNGPQHVIHPKDMHRYGKVLFDSGERDTEPDFPR